MLVAYQPETEGCWVTCQPSSLVTPATILFKCSLHKRMCMALIDASILSLPRTSTTTCGHLKCRPCPT